MIKEWKKHCLRCTSISAVNLTATTIKWRAILSNGSLFCEGIFPQILAAACLSPCKNVANFVCGIFLSPYIIISEGFVSSFVRKITCNVTSFIGAQSGTVWWRAGGKWCAWKINMTKNYYRQPRHRMVPVIACCDTAIFAQCERESHQIIYGFTPSIPVAFNENTIARICRNSNSEMPFLRKIYSFSSLESRKNNAFVRFVKYTLLLLSFQMNQFK